jgi:UDP-N-acetylglucosamine--N-acetylmuramyl-(pentapeptide) pyrophosphoryl-undecaprenol N-acetylglucosamine transferase
VYPALAVLQAIQNKIDESLWAGSEGGMEADLVRREGISFTEIPSAGVHGVGWRELPGNLAQLAKGYKAAKALLNSYRPDVILFTGGYVAVPVAVAGRKVPSVMFTPDIEPGLALRAVGRFADRIAVPVKDSIPYHPRRAQVEATGYPVREELVRWQPEQARLELGLREDLPVLLVYGGSKGARSINHALIKALPYLLPEMQVIHISGSLDWSWVRREAEDACGPFADRYRGFPYLHERMGAALAAADLAVARAGASTLGEFPAFGLPAFLVPYPHAWRYQQTNAKFLVERGGACLLPDDKLEDQLAQVVLALINDGDKIAEMRIAMMELYQPGAAGEIGDLILEAASARSGARNS